MSKGKQGTGGLTHVGEFLPGLAEFDRLNVTKPSAGTKALTVPGKHHFTRIKQIDALAGIGDDPNADMGFMARLLTLLDNRGRATEFFHWVGVPAEGTSVTNNILFISDGRNETFQSGTEPPEPRSARAPGKPPRIVSGPRRPVRPAINSPAISWCLHGPIPRHPPALPR